MKTITRLIQESNEKLIESSRSRILEHIGKHDCGFVTAYRSWIYPEGAEHKKENRVSLAKQTNQARNAQLLGDLHAKGYSVTSVKGGYIEDFGTENAKPVSEHTFFVVDISDKGRLQQDLEELGTKWFQDSILFVKRANPKVAEEIKAELIGTSPRKDLEEDFWPMPGTKHSVGSFKSSSGQFFTAIRNTPFRFESIAKEFPYERPSFFSRGFVGLRTLPILQVEELIEKNAAAYKVFL